MYLIRKGNIKDLTVLPSLNQEVFIDNQQYDPCLKMNWACSNSGKKYFKLLLTDSKQICFIAEHKHRPIGYLAGSIHKLDYRKGKHGEIDNMGVLPKYRSKGIGSKLVKSFIQ